MIWPSSAERAQLLERSRDAKMARSVHAYVRGNTRQFYAWLMQSSFAAEVPQGPAIWIGGDCHLGNLGPIRDGAGHVRVEIRDLDQTVIGNPAHDLIRLSLSLATAARGSDLPGVTTLRMIEAMVAGYDRALALDRDDPEELAEPDVVRTVKRVALGRRWRHLARERIDGPAPTIPLGKRFWPLEKDERAGLTRLFADPATKQHVLSLASRTAARDVALVDAAYWMKGCSSLGLLRYAVLLRIDADEHPGYALIDIKEATESVAPHSPGARMPADPAERVRAGACALSPSLGERMATGTLRGRSIFIRELAPQDLKLEVEQFSRGEAVKAARYLAFVLGKAHGRQMSIADRAAWRRELLERGMAAVEAPPWLWRTAVEQLQLHEGGYLEHCRDYAARVNEPDAPSRARRRRPRGRTPERAPPA